LVAQEKKLKSGMEKWRDRNQQSLCFREPNTLTCLLVATIFSLARQKIGKETKSKNKNLGHTNPTEKQQQPQIQSGMSPSCIIIPKTHQSSNYNHEPQLSTVHETPLSTSTPFLSPKTAMGSIPPHLSHTRNFYFR